MLLNLFRLITLRSLKLKPLRTALTLLGVGLGIGLTTAIDLINDSTLQTFRKDIDTVAGKAELSITGGEAGFPEELLEKLDEMEGIQALSPLVQARGFYTLKDTQASETLVIFGVDMLREKAARDYKTLETGEGVEDPLEFLAQPDSVILTQSFAKANGLKVGSSLKLSTSQGLRALKVRGLLAPEGPATAFGGNVAVMDIEAARLLFAKEGRLDRIDVVPAKGVKSRELADRIRALAGPGLQVMRPETRGESMESMVASFQTILRFVGSLALLVGLFMVINSMAISVAERRGEIGTLRSLGASRNGVLWIFMGEALVIGFLGSLLGLGLGRGLAELMLGPVMATLQAQFVENFNVNQIYFGWPQVASTLIFGVLTSGAAALWPAFKATRIEPIEAVKGARLGLEEAAPSRIYRALPRLGALMIVYLTIAATLKLSARFPALEMLNSFCAIVGSALFGPAIVHGLLGVLRPTLVRGNRTVLRLGADHLIRTPKRTASNVMTLMVGLLLVIIVATITKSFRGSILAWFDRSLNADILVSSSGNLVAFQTQPLHESVGQEIARVPGVDATEADPPRAMRFVHIVYENKRIGLKAVGEPKTEKDFYSIDVRDRDRKEAVKELISGDGSHVFVSENFVLHFGKKTGDRITLQSPNGPIEFTISGIVTDFANPTGVIYIPRSTYKKHWNDPLVTVFAVNAKPGYSPDDVRRAIDQTFGRDRGIIATSNESLRRQFETVVDRSFAMTRSIEIAALLVALLGLMNTLFIGVMERMRELGMLRAIGMSGRQMARMVITESLFQGGFTGLAAVSLGGWISYIWMGDSLSAVLGWVVDFHFPWISVFTTILTGVGVALVAGYYPARAAARLEIREALSYE